MVLFFFFLKDAPVAMQFSFQDPSTAVMEGIIDFHHDLMIVVVIISSLVSWLLFIIVWKFKESSYSSDKIRLNTQTLMLSHHTVLEVVWTIIPSLILLTIAIPSFALLYSMDEIVFPQVTVKIIGKQWYWSYEYSDNTIFTGEDNFLNFFFVPREFDSIMVATEDLKEGELRLLEVDNAMILPIKTHIRLLVSASDVIHSWAVPSMGCKIDAVPGRLNQISVYIKRPGIFYGQCSEICGINHAFMPIVVHAVLCSDYLWQMVNLSVIENGSVNIFDSVEIKSLV